jgi:hypothetical protein
VPFSFFFVGGLLLGCGARLRPLIGLKVERVKPTAC